VDSDILKVATVEYCSAEVLAHKLGIAQTLACGIHLRANLQLIYPRPEFNSGLFGIRLHIGRQEDKQKWQRHRNPPQPNSIAIEKGHCSLLTQTIWTWTKEATRRKRRHFRSWGRCCLRFRCDIHITEDHATPPVGLQIQGRQAGQRNSV
jgi:hypothetical protein